MKKVCCFALAIVLLFSLTACKSSNTGEKTDATDSSVTETVTFEKPENYASVVVITINPQFKLYLDAKGEVLAVEPVNDDAKRVAKDIDASKGDFKSVMKELVSATNKGGFAKENATVKVEITEIRAENIDTNQILTDAKTTATETFEDLAITVTVETAVDDNALKITSSAETVVSSESAPVSSKAHTHTYTAATCTKPKTCSCGATSGKALGHNYKEGVCSRCKAKDKNYTPSYTSLQNKGGSWNMLVLHENHLYDIGLTLYKSKEAGYGCGFGIGDPFSQLDEAMRNDPQTLEFSKEYKGEYFYFGRGDGDGLKAVTENGTTVTITDLEGNQLVLTRTSETTMKVTSCSANFVVFGKVPAGTILKYMADNNNE